MEIEFKARLKLFSDGNWKIIISGGDGQPGADEFIQCLTELQARTVGACIVIEPVRRQNREAA